MGLIINGSESDGSNPRDPIRVGAFVDNDFVMGGGGGARLTDYSRGQNFDEIPEQYAHLLSEEEKE